jgi:hypothetical protein
MVSLKGRLHQNSTPLFLGLAPHRLCRSSLDLKPLPGAAGAVCRAKSLALTVTERRSNMSTIKEGSMSESTVSAKDIVEESKRRGYLAKQLYVVFTTPVNGIGPVMENLVRHLEFQEQLER